MELRDHIAQIRDGLTTGNFPNEASVSQGIVLRFLQSLHWPIFDSTVVCPEYSVGGRRVDFALCHPPGKALVFIEVKNIGKDEGADRQLFEYAFHVGVPLAVLTDGRQWSFYLPGEQGSYDERRVYRLDLVDRDLDECEKRLQRYLNFSDCCSGKAVEAAKEDYRDQTKKRQIQQTLPQAWARLIKEPDELLVELLTNEVESLCGYKPDLDIVASFVRGQEATHTPPAETYPLHGLSSSVKGAVAKQKASPREWLAEKDIQEGEKFALKWKENLEIIQALTKEEIIAAAVKVVALGDKAKYPLNSGIRVIVEETNAKKEKIEVEHKASFLDILAVLDVNWDYTYDLDLKKRCTQVGLEAVR